MQTSEVPLEAINEAPDAPVPKRSSSTRSKKIRSKASVEISRRESDQCLTTKKMRNNGSMKRSKSFGEQPSSDLLDNLGLSPGILARKKRISNRSPKRNSSKSPKRETSESKLSPKPETSVDVSEESSATKRKERKSPSLKISKSSYADQTSATLSPDTNESLKAPPAPFCIENMGVSPSLLAKKKRSSSKSPMRQSDSMVADKKNSSLRRSKSDVEQSSSTSDLSDESSIATSSSILITSKAKQMMDSPVELVPKRFSSTRSKKLKSKASLESAISRRESDQCLTTKKKRNVSSMKRSKSFGEQASFASSDSTASTRPPSAIARSMLSIKEKPAVPKRSSSKNKKVNFGSNDVESSDKKERTGTGMKRSKSFGDTSKGLPRKQKASTSASKTDIKRSKSFGANNSTKSLLDTSDSRRSSKQNKKFGKSEAREIHGSSLMELLNVTLTPSEKDEIPKKKKVNKADLRVSFSDKALCKKIKHSKIDPSLIWYSEAELKEIREREKEVKRKARSCTSATLLNLEGLLSIEERNEMFQRMFESREAVYDAQNAHRRQKEMEAATALFRGGSYLESTLSDYYDEDEAIAEEYELFTVAAVHSAHERATHLAMHVNLMWDENFSIPAGKEAWHGIQIVATPTTAIGTRTLHPMLLAQ